MAKRRKCVIEQMFVDYGWIKIADKDVGPDVLDWLVMQRTPGDTKGSTKETNHIEHSNTVFCINRLIKLDEAIAIVCVRKFVLRHIDRFYAACLRKDLSEQLFRALRLKVSNVDSSILVPVFDDSQRRHCGACVCHKGIGYNIRRQV